MENYTPSQKPEAVSKVGRKVHQPSFLGRGGSGEEQQCPWGWWPSPNPESPADPPSCCSKPTLTPRKPYGEPQGRPEEQKRLMSGISAASQTRQQNMTDEDIAS